MSTTYTFNWHELSDHHDGDDGYEAYLRWATVHLLVDQSRLGTGNADLHEQVSAASDGFTRVSLTMQLNGVEVNPEHLMRAIHANMAHWAQQHATEQLTQLASFQQLKATVDLLEQAVTSRIEHVATDLGVDLRSEVDL